VKSSALSISELKALHGRHLAAAYKIWAEIQKREGTENIEGMISRLPKTQRSFLHALWKAPNKRLSISDLERKVWGKTENEFVPPTTIKHAAWRVGNSIEKYGIPLFIDEVKQKNGDIWGYAVKEKKRV
jgi:DNA-binding response OmpR family regulator